MRREGQASISLLTRHCLIMGVHPGCPVWLIVAVSLVAVETVVGEPISAAKVAFVCGLRSVGVVLLLYVGPFPTSAFISFSSPDLRCWFRVLLHLMRSAARSSQDSMLMSSAFMSLLQTSLKHSCGQPLILLPDANSPNSCQINKWTLKMYNSFFVWECPANGQNYETKQEPPPPIRI